MIQKKYYGLVMSVCLSILMGGTMSGAITAINTGIGEGFLDRWRHSFVLAAPIAFIVMQFLRPLAAKIADTLTNAK